MLPEVLPQLEINSAGCIPLFAIGHVMDVKSKISSGPLLQKSLSRPAPSSVTRADGYVHVQGPKPLPTPSPSSLPSHSTQGGVRSAADSKCAKAAEPDAATALTTDSPQSGASHLSGPSDPVIPVTEEQIVRAALVSSMQSERNVRTRKIYYVTIQGEAQTQGAETHNILNGPTIGTGFYQRTGPQIRMHSIKIRAFLYVYGITDVTANASVVPPMIRFVLKYNKVPVTPGTAEVAFATGANPPDSVVTLYSGLGVSPAAQSALSTAVINPASLKFEHIAGITLPNNSAESSPSSGSDNSPQHVLINAGNYGTTPKTYTFNWHIPLHGRVAAFTSAQIGPVTNAIEFDRFPIFSPTLQAMTFSFTSELEFEDIATN